MYVESSPRPRVSIITPFLNNEAFIAETIDSVVGQTYGNWEYLLVDDGSGPAATAIAKQYAQRHPAKIRYLEHPNHLNRGISATRNLGVRQARGEFLAFLDSDDIWLPSKLADHVAVLDSHAEVGMVCGTTVEWNSWLGGQDRILPTGRQQDMILYPQGLAASLFPLGNDRTASFSDVVFRAELVKQLGGFEEQFTGLYDDQVLLLKVYLSTPVYFCSRISNKYRQNPASISHTSMREGLTPKGTLLFLEWLEQYLKPMDYVDPTVTLALHRALRPFRNPRIDYLLSLSMKARNKFRRLAGRALRFPAQLIRG